MRSDARQKTFRFAPEISDEIFRKFYFFNTFRRGPRFRRLLGLAVILFLFALCNFSIGGRYFGIFFLAVSLLIPFLYWYRYFTGMKYQIRSQGLDKQPVKPYTVELGKSGIRISSPRQDVHFPWENIAAVDAGEELYLYYCPSRAVILPYKDLRGEEKSAVVSYLSDTLGDRLRILHSRK